jgi:transcriptional regulator with XRE-family HTH domain
MSGKTSSSPHNPLPRNTRLRQARKKRRLSQEIVAKQIGVATLTYSRWEKGETFPTQYNLRSLCDFFGMSDEQLGFANEQEHSSHSEDTPRIWNVPFEPNPFFTGREGILETLHNTLRNGKTTALTQKQAISGLGGIGKTQTAIEYAYRYANEYEIVLWVKADSRDSITSDFVGIAHLLNLPEKDEQDQNLIVAEVNRWLKSRKNWLLILDNADDVMMASDFIHPMAGGHVLLTTRAQNIGSIAYRITIEQMVQEEGVRFLLRRARTLERDISLDSISKTDRTFATKIVELLGGLPLALDQAGAYIQETACGLKGYLERYEKHRAELLELRGKAFMGHPEPVATTWSLSFERLQQTSPAAADLLRVCAFLHPDAIPEEIFLEGASELGPFLQSITSEVGLDALIGELRRHSLLDRYAENKTLRVHRLVQAVLRDSMSEETQHQWIERIVRALNALAELYRLRGIEHEYIAQSIANLRLLKITLGLMPQ